MQSSKVLDLNLNQNRNGKETELLTKSNKFVPGSFFELSGFFVLSQYFLDSTILFLRVKGMEQKTM